MNHNYVWTSIKHGNRKETIKLTNIHVTHNGTIYVTHIDEKGNEHVRLLQADMTLLEIYA